MASAFGGVVEIVSDDEEIPVGVKPPGDVDALEWASHLLLDDLKRFGEDLDDSAVIQEFLASLEGEKNSACDVAAGGGSDDDDCVMLDGDPVKAVVVTKEKRRGEDGSEEELQIVAEKGEVACRDFPHPRHLCANLPFRTSSHANHCTMCHCYVCDSPAPCSNWGKGTSPTDHCHATDKDEKWKKLRLSFKRKSLPSSKRGSIKKSGRSSSTTPSSPQYAVHQVSAPQPFPQPFPPLGTTLNQPSAARVPVAIASNASQNQQMHPSVRAAQNVGQVVHLPKASPPGPKISGRTFKRSGAAPPVCAPSNGYSLNRALLNNVPYYPVSSRVFQTTQVASGMNTIAGPVQRWPPQHSRIAPVISQGLQAHPTSHLQVAPNRLVGAGLQLRQCSALTIQGTQCVQEPSAIQQAWQAALANLASELGVSEYSVNPQHGQHSASIQSLHPGQLLAQVNASQGGELRRSHVPAAAQMRPSNGHRLRNQKSGDSVVAMQKGQALCILNSQSSLTSSETSLDSFVAKPATEY